MKHSAWGFLTHEERNTPGAGRLPPRCASAPAPPGRDPRLESTRTRGTPRDSAHPAAKRARAPRSRSHRCTRTALSISHARGSAAYASWRRALVDGSGRCSVDSSSFTRPPSVPARPVPLRTGSRSFSTFTCPYQGSPARAFDRDYPARRPRPALAAAPSPPLPCDAAIPSTRRRRPDEKKAPAARH